MALGVKYRAGKVRLKCQQATPEDGLCCEENVEKLMLTDGAGEWR